MKEDDRYICHGSVQIHLGDRLITADEAQITSDLSAIWTQGTARLIDGENIFCSEAIYARPFEGQAYFFGTLRCKLKRPRSRHRQRLHRSTAGRQDWRLRRRALIDSDGEKGPSSTSRYDSPRTRSHEHRENDVQRTKRRVAASADWLRVRFFIFTSVPFCLVTRGRSS